MKKIIAVLLMGLTVLSLCACSVNIGAGKDADKYTAGNAEIKDKVENIEIDWASGKVDFAYNDGDAILLEESYTGELPDDQKMHWYLDGTTLKVRYDIKLGGLSISPKNLTVTLPKTLSLKDLKIDVASAEVNAKDILAETMYLSAASGNANLSFNSELKNAEFSTASGNLTAEFHKAVETVDADTASGDVRITAADRIGNLDVDSASGKVEAAIGVAPDKVNIDSASGDVTLVIPENTDFTLNVDTASGDFDSDLPLAKDGDNYISGAGTAQWSIDTASGGVRILKK